MHMGTLLSALSQLLMLILLGYSLRKFGIITESLSSGLSKLLLSVVIPASVIVSGNNGALGVTWQMLIIIAAVTSLTHFSVLAMGKILFSKVGKRENADLNTAMCMYPNTGFIGIPLASVLYGADGLMCAVTYNLILGLHMYTIGIKMIGSGKEKIKWLNIIKNPLTIASVLSIVLFLSPLHLPSILADAALSVGNMSTPISMLIIGSWLVGVDVKEMLKTRSCHVVCAMRLLIIPAICFVVLYFLDMPYIIKAVSVLCAALPLGSLNVLFAKQYGADYIHANESMILSLVLSIATIPLFVLLNTLL